MSPTKKCLTLYEKSLVIQKLNAGQTVTHLAKKYGVAKSTICKIRNRKEMISTAVRETYLGPGKRQTLKSSAFPEMEKMLYTWFLDQRNQNYSVSGEMVKQKAKLIHSQIKENDKQFTASEGWLQRFKNRFGIRFIELCGEKLSSQPDLVDPFKIELKDKIEELDITMEHIYNADETGLYWKLLPHKTFISVAEKTAADRKIEMQRITFLACTNATGTHKVKPLVIGRVATPKSFENFDCPVDYQHSKSAWMTANIFKHWFHYLFVPQVRIYLKDKGLPQKALLLLDNAPYHPNEDELKSDDGQIVTMFLPHHVIQPMNENVIRLTKLYYRNNLLSTVIENNKNVFDTLKELTSKDAVNNLMSAWNHLDPEIIKKCWRNILNGVVSNYDDDKNVPLDFLKLEWDNNDEHLESKSLELLRTLAPQETFEESDVLEWNRCDDNLIIEDNVIEECQNDQKVENNYEPSKRTFAPDSVMNALNVVTQWAEESDVDINDLFVIKRLREKAMQNLKKTKK